MRNGGFVYVVAANSLGPVKIGQTTTPRSRIKAIECGIGSSLPFVWVSEACMNYLELERELHEAHSRQRQRGEWFAVFFEDAVRRAKALNFVRADLPPNFEVLRRHAESITRSRMAALDAIV